MLEEDAQGNSLDESDSGTKNRQDKKVKDIDESSTSLMLGLLDQNFIPIIKEKFKADLKSFNALFFKKPGFLILLALIFSGTLYSFFEGLKTRKIVDTNDSQIALENKLIVEKLNPKVSYLKLDQEPKLKKVTTFKELIII